MRRKSILLALLALLVGALALMAAGCGGGDGGDGESAAGTGEEQTTGAAAEPITIELKEENNSGQTGTATLRPGGDTFDVELEVTPPKKFEGEYQRAYVRNVTCAEYRQNPSLEESVTDELNDLADGESSSTVYAPLSERSGSSINVHEQNDPFTVVACGDIPKQ